jgi:cytochrome c oxidase subunit 2
MRATTRWNSALPGLVSLVAALAVVGCNGTPSPLDPRTSATARIAELGWVMFVLATLVCAVVFGGLLLALRAAPRETGSAQRPAAWTAGEGGANQVVIWAGMVIPAAILVFTFGYTVWTLRQVTGAAGAGGSSSFATAAHDDHTERSAPGLAQADQGILPTVTMNVTGHQWWWEVEYPDAGIVTANEIRIPHGVPVQLKLTSQDVIHSFWVPQVTGKVDLIPGKTNLLTVRADQPGTYRGLCGEFCGLQHARMHLRMVVETAEAYVGWLERERQPARPPTTPEAEAGQRVFVARCGECHTVRGVTSGTNGPDLTHLASRLTLGAGIHENTRSNLAAWAADAQTMKPGNKMPSIPLAADDLSALVTYLEGLE